MTNGRDAFKAVVEEWIRAANERDVDACKRLRAPEYKLLLSNGKRVTRAVVEEAYFYQTAYGLTPKHGKREASGMR